MNKIIVSCIKRSKDTPRIEYYSRFDGQFRTYSTTAELLADEAHLVSFDWDNVILSLREQGEPMPTDIIDIEQVAKQLNGIKKS